MTPSPLLNQAKLCSPLTKKILHAPDSSIHPRIPAEPQLKVFFFCPSDSSAKSKAQLTY